jgi:hypothetical protein
MANKIILATLLLTAIPEAASTQDQPPRGRSALADSSVPQIMAARLRGPFPDGAILDVLRQRGRPVPEAKRSELADSIVALAKRTRGALSAILALSEAGISHPDYGGEPDPRAFDWLVRIHREASDLDTRMAALEGLLRLADHSRVLAYLRDVATQPGTDYTAGHAVGMLAKITERGDLPPDERQQAMAHLREMWDGRLATNRWALRALEQFAAAARWPRPPEQ